MTRLSCLAWNRERERGKEGGGERGEREEGREGREGRRGLNLTRY